MLHASAPTTLATCRFRHTSPLGKATTAFSTCQKIYLSHILRAFVLNCKEVIRNFLVRVFSLQFNVRFLRLASLFGIFKSLLDYMQFLRLCLPFAVPSFSR